MTERTWNMRVLTDWEAVWSNDFVAHWLDLMDRSFTAHVFFHPTIVKVWVDTYRPLRTLKPIFVHAQREDQEVLLPLVMWHQQWKGAFLRNIVPVGYSDFDYHDPIFLKQPNAAEIAEVYAEMKTCLLSTVRFDRLVIDGLHEMFVPEFAKIVRRVGCISWPLGNLEHYRGVSFPKKRSRTQVWKRRMRRLAETGSIHFRRFCGNETSRLRNSVSKMLECHERRWPQAYRAPNFHAQLIDTGLKSGLMELFEVSVNETPVAWNVCFTYRDRLGLYMPVFDEGFSKYDVGHICTGFAVQCALEDGMTVVDHLRGEEDYKRFWGGNTDWVHDIVYDRACYASRLRIVGYEVLRSAKEIRSVALGKFNDRRRQAGLAATS